MVIIWLMMVNNNLVGGFSPTPLKNDGVSSSVGMMKFSTEWKVIIFMFQTTNQAGYSWFTPWRNPCDMEDPMGFLDKKRMKRLG